MIAECHLQQFDLMSMSQENRAQLWIDRTKGVHTIGNLVLTSSSGWTGGLSRAISPENALLSGQHI